MNDLSEKLIRLFESGEIGNESWNTITDEYALPDILTEISELLYVKKLIEHDKTVALLKGLDCFKTRKKEIKTIGTFYHRMYNGGVERVISLLSDIWTNSGYKVILFTEEEPSEDDYTLPDSVKRVIIPKVDKNSDRDDFKNRINVFVQYINEYNVDVMVYHAWLFEYFVCDELTVKSTGIPFIVYAHGVFSTGFTAVGSNGSFYSATQEKTYSMCDTVVTLSSVDTAWWSSFGIPCKQVVNPNTFSFDGGISPLDSKNILWVGRFSKEKQVFDALKAMQIIHTKDKDAKLLLAGKGETEKQTEEVAEYIKENGMCDYVELAGYVTSLEEYYKRASLLLITSKFEGFPMVAVESAVSGVPILMYEIPSLEIIHNNSGVSIVEQNDYKALACRAAELLENRDLLKEKGRLIRRDIEKMYSADQTEVWKDIFAFSLSKKPEYVPVYKRDNMSIAVSTAMYHVLQNFKESAENLSLHKKWIKHLENDVASLNSSVDHLNGVIERLEAENQRLTEDNKKYKKIFAPLRKCKSAAGKILLKKRK